MRSLPNKKRYDRHRKFQTEWAAKFPWAEGVLASDGILHLVRCRVCTTFDKKPCLMAPKSDTLLKHDGKRTARKDMPLYKVKAGESYIATNCRHRKNLRLYAARPPATILEAVNNCTSIEVTRKRVQFATLSQILSECRPMLEYESRLSLYELLKVPNLPHTHWSDNSGWTMAKYMYKQVTNAIKKFVQQAHYIAMTVDEVTTVDNGSWLSLHCYVMENWRRMPLLVCLKKVDVAPNADNLISLIIECVQSGGGVDREMVARKLLSFGADGATVLQGCRFGVTVQITRDHAPFAMGVHCVAHRCNLACKALSSIGIFVVIEKALNMAHAYFARSPKRYSEFNRLAELIGTKGLKMLRVVETRWVSLIEPLRRLLSEYRTLIYKMVQDLKENEKAQVRFLFMFFELYAFS